MFADRAHAGRELARHVEQRMAADPAYIVVLGLPRGGVIVAREVAAAVGASLDIVVVRKLGAPSNPEFAIGAIAEDDARVLDERAIAALRVTPGQLAAIEDQERRELERRSVAYRRGRERRDVSGATVVLVDDGLATGATMLAAIRSVRSRHPARVIVAVPVAPRDTVELIRGEADDVLVVEEPEPFGAVGRFYRDFAQTTDVEVLAALG